MHLMRSRYTLAFMVLLTRAWPANAAENKPALLPQPEIKCSTGDWVEFEVRLTESKGKSGKENQPVTTGKAGEPMRFRLTVLRQSKTTIDVQLRTWCNSKAKSNVRRNIKAGSIFKSTPAISVVMPEKPKPGDKIMIRVGKAKYAATEQTWQTTTLTGKSKVTSWLCEAIPFGLASLKTSTHSLRVVGFGNQIDPKKEPLFPHPNMPVTKIALQAKE